MGACQYFTLLSFFLQPNHLPLPNPKQDAAINSCKLHFIFFVERHFAVIGTCMLRKFDFCQGKVWKMSGNFP